MNIIQKTSHIKPVKPKLTRNKYFGEPSNWLNFWNQFESSIHKNESLSFIDKFVI